MTFEPITTQDELDRIINQRLARERAKSKPAPEPGDWKATSQLWEATSRTHLAESRKWEGRAKANRAEANTYRDLCMTLGQRLDKIEATLKDLETLLTEEDI